MSYRTIFETPQQNQVILIKNIFETNHIDYRFLDESTNTNFALGVRVQVKETDASRAQAILKENGLLNEPESGKDAVSLSRFWMWLVLALLAIIVASVLINMLM